MVLSVPAGQSSTLPASVQKTLAGTPGVASATTPQVNQAGDTAVMTVVPTTGRQDPATTDLVDDLCDEVLPSVGAAYGVVMAVFQWGWGSSLVGLDETVPIPAFVPMLMFAIVFGLSMDYEVLLLSRVHEAYVDIKMLAVGMAVSVLIDASIVRMVLVPAVMSLLGDRAWWLPRWLDRILPRIDIEGARPQTSSAADVVSAPAGSTSQ